MLSKFLDVVSVVVGLRFTHAPGVGPARQTSRSTPLEFIPGIKICCGVGQSLMLTRRFMVICLVVPSRLQKKTLGQLQLSPALKAFVVRLR